MRERKPPVESEHDVDAAHAVIHESDRGCVLVLAAQVDECLERLLRSFFVADKPKLVDSLFAGFGPLQTFAAKIAVCRALGLITSDTRTRVDAIRNLRNEFAHTRQPLTLGSRRCADRVRVIVGDEKAQDALVRSYLRRGFEDSESEGGSVTAEAGLDKTARRRLALGLTITKLAGHIEGYADGKFRILPAELLQELERIDQRPPEPSTRDETS
jgi:hypothetical protein